LYYHVLNSPPNTVDFKEYVYINSTKYPSTSGDYYQVGGFSSTLGGNYGNGGIFVFNSGGTLRWGLYYRNNGTFYQAISSSNVSIGWSCVEMQHVTSTGASDNGEEHLWLNGADIKDITGISNNDRALASAVIGGSQKVTNPNDTWNYYVDDFVVTSTYIGPTPAPSHTSTPAPSPSSTLTAVPTLAPTIIPTDALAPTPTPTSDSSATTMPIATPANTPTSTPASVNPNSGTILNDVLNLIGGSAVVIAVAAFGLMIRRRKIAKGLPPPPP
jgi:hypothetical protein